jgi:hypothetical protein
MPDVMPVCVMGRIMEPVFFDMGKPLHRAYCKLRTPPLEQLTAEEVEAVKEVVGMAMNAQWHADVALAEARLTDEEKQEIAESIEELRQAVQGTPFEPKK